MDNLVVDVSPEQLELHFSALSDSVSLINDQIQKAEDSEYAKDSILRNYQHIEIMLDKDFIKNSERDLTEFINAVAAAKAYLA